MIEMRDVAFAYPRGGALFKGLTLSLPRGSFHFLTGPSGAGKTTFLRLCIADLLPSAGQMTLFGEDAATLGRDAIAGVRRRIGVVFQDFRLIPHLSAADNIALPLRVAGIAESEVARAVREMLNWIGLSERAAARPATLSGGEQQRVALARSLAPAPRVLLLDEPLSALDADLRRRLAEDIRTVLRAAGTTGVVVTHDLAEAAVMADRTVRLGAGGRIAAEEDGPAVASQA